MVRFSACNTMSAMARGYDTIMGNPEKLFHRNLLNGSRIRWKIIAIGPSPQAKGVPFLIYESPHDLTKLLTNPVTSFGKSLAWDNKRMNALPTIAPAEYSEAFLKVSLFEIPKPIKKGFLSFNF